MSDLLSLLVAKNEAVADAATPMPCGCRCLADADALDDANALDDADGLDDANALDNACCRYCDGDAAVPIVYFPTKKIGLSEVGTFWQKLTQPRSDHAAFVGRK